MIKENETETRILASSRKIFQKKGLQGARMQEIADDAGINKAMLHYYYRSKDKLFEAVFREASQNFFPKVFMLLNTDLPLFEKIEYFISNYIDLLLENPDMPGFILNEINQNPKNVHKMFSGGILKPDKLIAQVKDAIVKNEIVHLDARHLILNMMSMCVFPIAARVVVKEVLNLQDEQYIEFIKERKREIPRFVINSIKK